ncbi:MAG: cytochrome c, partial [Gammaproteobacteria bacterium]|nr:cytochrome c [Gammaproteobacteria bacterium]
MIKNLLLPGLLFIISLPAYSSNNPGEDLFKTHCAICHGANRLGLMGPALLPENLKRLRKKQAVNTIMNGRPATQMPAFKDKLKPAEIDDLVSFIYTPLKETPHWAEKEIWGSQIIYSDAQNLPDKPVWDADP